jgi:hypothetical protein
MGYLFRRVREDGAEADPPSFASGFWGWKPGDTLLEGNPRYRIIDIVGEEDSDVQATFVVAPL